MRVSILTKPCRKCGAIDRSITTGTCLPCGQRISAAYRASNGEKIKTAYTIYGVVNKSRIDVYAAAYRKANPEKIKSGNAAWYAANIEKVKVTDAVYQKANIVRLIAYRREYRKANSESRLIHQQNRRAKTAGGKLSQGLAATLFAQQGGLCYCCKQPLGDKTPHLDHWMPLKLGGSNTDDNMKLLHQRCNNQKHAKHPVDFMQSLGYLF